MNTPFSVGRRSKVRTAADDLWEGDQGEVGGATEIGRGFDGENPLGTQVDEDVSSRMGVFKPVYAEDGFIVARDKPTRQVSQERLTLLVHALMACTTRERERERESSELHVALSFPFCRCQDLDVLLFELRGSSLLLWNLRSPLHVWVE